MREQLVELLEPVVRSQGFVLWELEYVPRRSNGFLRLYIDVPAGSERGIEVDDCAKVSHAVSDALDAADPIPVEYTLEVSSPGVDRVLRTAEHFGQFVGERAQVEMKLPVNNRRRFLGKILTVTDDELCLEQDGVPVALSLSGINKARLDPEFE